MKMNKFLIGILMVFLLSGLALSIPYNPNNQVNNRANHQGNVSLNLQGLQKAISVVNSTVAISHLQENLQKLNSTDQDIVGRLENLTVKNSTKEIMEIEGIKTAKFLGVFSFPHTYIYELNQTNYGLQRVKGIFDFLWKDE